MTQGKPQKMKLRKGVLSKLSQAQLNTLIGEITSLMMLSKVHRVMQVRDIPDIILPAINLNQFRIYRNSKKQAIGLVTWAYFSGEVEKEYLKGKGLLSEKELKSGDIIFVTDFIAPYGHTKKIIKDLQENIFPDDEVKALRFTEQGKHRKQLWKFYGANYNNKIN